MSQSAEQIEGCASILLQEDTLLVAEIRASIAGEFDAVQREVARHQQFFRQLDATVQNLDVIRDWRWRWTWTLTVVSLASIVSGFVIGIY